MDADKFQTAVIAELAALKYVIEQVGQVAFLAATMRPEHAAAMRETAREKLTSERYPGLEEVWSPDLGTAIADSVAAVLTNIETNLAESYKRPATL